MQYDAITLKAINGALTPVSARAAEGEIEAISLAFNGGVAATTVVIASVGNQSPAQTILTLGSGNTNAWYYPRVGANKNDGTALLYAAGGTLIPVPYFVMDDLKLTAGAVNIGDITAVIYVRRL